MLFRHAMFSPNNLLTRLLSDSKKYDIAVVGAGPGGYVAAIKAAQLGFRTVCIEKNETLGGTCLNVGCIPSKALLNMSHHYHLLKSKKLESFGIQHGSVSFDLEKMMNYKKQVVSGLTGGISSLFKANKVDRINGFGRIKSKNEIAVTSSDNKESVVQASNIIIATGSESTPFPGINVDEEVILSSTGALSLKKVPQNMVIIGAGIIGLELGSVWSRLGSKVTAIEYLDHVGGAVIDSDVSESLKGTLKKLGMKFELGKKVVSAKKHKDTVTVEFVDKNNESSKEHITCDALLVCVGRRPSTKDIGLENVGVKTDSKGFITVNDCYMTSCDGVYAIGDCVPGPMLAHKAEDEGVACVERINGLPVHVDFNSIPSVIYTHPEVAWVGKTEQAVKQMGIKYKVGKFPLIANGRSKAVGDTDGFVKIITDENTDVILGAHIISSCAGEVINQLAMALEYKASAEDVARVCHAHPTVAEAIREACMKASFGKAIHSL